MCLENIEKIIPFHTNTEIWSLIFKEIIIFSLFCRPKGKTVCSLPLLFVSESPDSVISLKIKHKKTPIYKDIVIQRINYSQFIILTLIFFAGLFDE